MPEGCRMLFKQQVAKERASIVLKPSPLKTNVSVSIRPSSRELQCGLLRDTSNLWGGERKGNYFLNSSISFQTWCTDSNKWCYIIGEVCVLKKSLTCLVLEGNSYLIRFQDSIKFSLVTGKWHLSAEQFRKHGWFELVEASSRQFSAPLLWLIWGLYPVGTGIHLQSTSQHLLFPWPVYHQPRISAHLIFCSP